MAPTPTSTTLPEVTPPPGYELVWRDEFAGTELDRSKWNIEHSTFGDGGNTLHCYVPEAVAVDDGQLVLTGERQQMICPNGSSRAYTSGMVSGEGRAAWRYGWFEVRARVPEGRGLWPAIWMSPRDNVYGRWPASGEIDLMELRGDRPRTARVNVHYLDTLDRRAQSPHDVNASPGDGFAEAFHTFGLRWEPNLMVFTVDGLEIHTVRNWSSSVGSADAPFDQEFFFRLNLAIGGNYPGSPDETTSWPARFEIDWVRVFQPVS
jgi:beta-glucanase (GH16 family)